MSISLTDNPSDIFKLFEFLSVIQQFEEQHAIKDHGSIMGKEIILQGDFDSQKDIVCPSMIAVEKPPDTEDGRSSKQEAEHPVDIEEESILSCLELLSRELIPDSELLRLPADAINDVFPFFMRANFQMPDIDETPLGSFLLKKKEEQIEDLSTYELEQMLSFALKENTMLHIQNDIFRRFLKKNDPRYNDGNVSLWEAPTSDDQDDDISQEISTAEMVESKVIFPDIEDYDSEHVYRAVLSLYTRVVEHEIKSVHKEYEVELNKFNARMKDLSSTKNALNIHRDKIRETSTLLKVMIVKKQLKKKKKKVIFNSLQFAEFLKAAIKQDQQDLRRFRVMIYEHKRKLATIQKKMRSSDSIRRVDLELYEIKAKQLTAKLNEINEEFLQLKKIFDSYQKRLDKFQKRLEINKKMLVQNQKTYSKKLRDLEVQHTCYKMAHESISEVMNFIFRLHSSVLQRANDAACDLKGSTGDTSQ